MAWQAKKTAICNSVRISLGVVGGRFQRASWVVSEIRLDRLDLHQDEYSTLNDPINAGIKISMVSR